MTARYESADPDTFHRTLDRALAKGRYVTDSAETLAEALHKYRHLCHDPECPERVVALAQVRALIASGAVRPAAEVRAEAWDEGYDAMGTDWHDGTRDNPYLAALTEDVTP